MKFQSSGIQVRPSARSSRQGFNLTEVVISSILVGTLLIAALRAVGMSVSTQSIMADESKAAWLADALLMEIYQQSYMEPGTTTSPIGLNTDETSSSRALYDDVDDYHTLNEVQIKTKSGTSIPDLANWTRSVTVSWVVLNNGSLVTTATETGVKRIDVLVNLSGRTLATRSIVRTKG